MATTIETDLKEVLNKLDQRFDRLEQKLDKMNADITDLKVNQEKLSGQINVLDEKVSGIGKRVENQEFTNRSILVALVVTLIAGAIKFFYPFNP